MPNATTACSPWNPTSAEVASYLAEMRPVIDRFAQRDRAVLLACAAEPAHG